MNSFQDHLHFFPNPVDNFNLMKQKKLSEDSISDALKQIDFKKFASNIVDRAEEEDTEDQKPSLSPATPEPKPAPVQSKPASSPRRDYRDVAAEATRASLERQNRQTTIPGMPALSAHREFTSQSIARSAAPGAVSGVAGQGGSTPYSDIAALGAMTPEKQASVVPGLGTKRLQDMRQAQYSTSKQNVAAGKGSQKMGDNRASAVNAINAELEDRRTNPMGGKDAAASYVRSWQQDPSGLRTQQSMAVRTPRERMAMLDAMNIEAKKQFKEKGKLDPKFVEALNKLKNTK